jgi:phenolic acid decarboxylase
MKNLKSLVLFTLLLGTCGVLPIACSKNKSTTAPSTKVLTGSWVGTQTEEGSSSMAIGFTFKTDHTIDFYVDGRLVDGAGEWLLQNNTLNITYNSRFDPNATYVYTATYDSKTGLLSAGTWYVRENTMHGTFTLTKQ